MYSELENIERKITAAEESYKQIESAWLSANEINSRIESLLVIAQELRVAERSK